MKIIILVLLLLTAEAHGATYWASTSGGAGTCAAASGTSDPKAYRTFVQGVACLSSGDTLILKSGTYTTIFNTNTTALASGSGSRTTIRAENIGGAIFQPASGNEVFNIVGVGASAGLHDIAFSGLVIDGANTSYGIVVGNATNNIRFTDVEVKNVGGPFARVGTGVSIQHSTSNTEFIRGSVHDNGRVNFVPPDAGYGFYTEGDSITVESVAIYNNGGYGIHGYTGFGEPHNNHIYRYNTLYNNCLTIQQNGCSAIAGEVGTGYKVYGNLVYNNAQRGIGIATSGGVVANNTVVGNGHWGISYNGSIAVTIENNIIQSNTLGDFTDDGTGAGKITFGANLCAAAGTGCAANGNANLAANYSLQASSKLALNTGIDVSSLINCTPITTCRDITGLPRPQSSGWDLGAYEYGSSSPIVVAITGSNPSCPGFISCTVTQSSIVLSGTTTATSAGQVTAATDREISNVGATWSPGSQFTTNPITLKSGVNVVTVNSTDALGNSGTATVTVTYAPTFPGAALVAAYDFETGSGTTASDSSGNNNTATFVGGATWTTTAHSGSQYAVLLNGTNQYVQAPDANSLDFTQSFTISAWVFPTSVMTTFRSIVSKADNASGHNPVIQLFGSIEGYCGSGGPGAFVQTNGIAGPRIYVCDSTPLQLNTWTHLALVYDRVSLRLYRNGALAPNSGNSIGTTASTAYMEPTSDPLYIGASQYGEYFPGIIDQVRLYNTGLSRTSTNNTTPNAPCNAEEYSVATASVVGDMNCPVIPLVSPPAFWIGASSVFEIGSGAQFSIGATQ